MTGIRTLFPTVAAALLLAGCMAEGSFPSLAQRDVERQPQSEPVRTMPNVPSDASLNARIAELLAAARQGQRDFEAAFGSAEAAARTAGAPQSDSWIEAQEQISRAEAARAGTTRALGDLDRLALDRSDLPTSSGDQAALEAALQEVERLARDQQVRIDRLKAITAR